MDVFCVGMYRSASTWQYEVASHLLERHRGARRLGFVAGEQYDDRAGETGWRILKAHDAHPALAEQLRAKRALAIYAYRDLRDVAYSLLHKLGGSFVEILEERQVLHICLDNDRFWRSLPGVHCQRYEDIRGDPVAAVNAIAGHLEIHLGPSEAEELAQEYSLEANRQRAAALANQLQRDGVDLANRAQAQHWDERTLLHWNHVREGSVGSWRTEASPREIAILAAICGSWLMANGYEPDLAWALPGLEHLQRELARTQQALHDTRQQLRRMSSEPTTRQRLRSTARRLTRRVAAACQYFLPFIQSPQAERRS